MEETTRAGPVIWPWRQPTIFEAVDALVGRKIRFVKPGGVVTDDFIPHRVTVYLTDDHRIERIHVEADAPIGGNG